MSVERTVRVSDHTAKGKFPTKAFLPVTTHGLDHLIVTSIREFAASQAPATWICPTRATFGARTNDCGGGVTGAIGLVHNGETSLRRSMMTGESSKLNQLDGKAPTDPVSKVPRDDTADEVLVDKQTVDGHIAHSLGKHLQMLTDDFWSHAPARIEKINLRKDELTFSVRLPFLSPPAFGDSGDRLATQDEVDKIRIGFTEFLREGQLTRKRLASFFYHEFYDFLLGHSKTYRFNDDIRKRIGRPGEKRLAGRSALPIPKSRKEAVEEQVQMIRTVVLQIQKDVIAWKRKEPRIAKDAILDRLKLEYDRERFPWSRYAFRSVNTLPGKRTYLRKPGHSKKLDPLTRPSIAEPERWSVDDIAAKWTQDWFYAEHGNRYDLREIRQLLRTS